MLPERFLFLYHHSLYFLSNVSSIKVEVTSDPDKVSVKMTNTT